MNKKLLRQLQARHEKRLSQLQGQIESGELREADLPAVQEEIDGLIDELQNIKDELGEDEPDPEPATDPEDGEGRSAEGDGEGAEPEGEPAADPATNENRAGMITQQQPVSYTHLRAHET